MVFASFLLAACVVANSFATNYSAGEYDYTVWAVPFFEGSDKEYDAISFDFNIAKSSEGVHYVMAGFQPKMVGAKEGSTSGGDTAIGYRKRDGVSYFEIIVREMSYDGNESEPTLVYPTDAIQNDEEYVSIDVAHNIAEGQWYNVLVYSWQDDASNTTRLGLWAKTADAKTWDLVSVVDTDVPNWRMSDFAAQLYNYDAVFAEDEHELQLRNINVHRFGGSWSGAKAIAGTMGSQKSSADGKGKHEFALNGDVFSMLSGGVVENQESYDAARGFKEVSFAINNSLAPEVDLRFLQTSAKVKILSEEVKEKMEEINQTTENVRNYEPNVKIRQPSEAEGAVETMSEYVNMVVGLAMPVVVCIVVLASVKKSQNKTTNGGTQYRRSSFAGTRPLLRPQTPPRSMTGTPSGVLGTAPKVEFDKDGRPKPII